MRTTCSRPKRTQRPRNASGRRRRRSAEPTPRRAIPPEAVAAVVAVAVVAVAAAVPGRVRGGGGRPGRIIGTRIETMAPAERTAHARAGAAVAGHTAATVRGRVQLLPLPLPRPIRLAARTASAGQGVGARGPSRRSGTGPACMATEHRPPPRRPRPRRVGRRGLESHVPRTGPTGPARRRHRT